MDLLAALALVLVIEGLALAIFCRSLPAVIAEVENINPVALRRVGIVMLLLGGAGYLLIRQGTPPAI